MEIVKTGRIHEAMAAGTTRRPRFIQLGNREEAVAIHDTGYFNRDIRMAFGGAHPDDTALDGGAMPYVINAAKRRNPENPYDVHKTAGLFVLTATRGERSPHPILTPDTLGVRRVFQDADATAIYEADGVANWQYSDLLLFGREEELIETTAEYLGELDPHVVFLQHYSERYEHNDHVVMQRAAKEALRRNGQKPLVFHTDTQNGSGEVKPTTILRIPPYIHRIHGDHFFAHETESLDLVDAQSREHFGRVMDSTRVHGERYAVPNAAILEQDLSGDFSTERPEEFFGDRGIRDVFVHPDRI